MLDEDDLLDEELEDDDPSTAARWILRAAVVVLAAGALAFIVKGADRPKDPFFAEGGTSTTEQAEPEPDNGQKVEPEGFGEVKVRVVDADGVAKAWCLLAAVTQAQRQRGLMEVESLGDHPGMAFVYENDVENGFYMENTPMPLSIAWVAADGRVVDSVDMDPCLDAGECPTYFSDEPYRFAIEVPVGGLPGLGISEDATVDVGGACPAA